MKTVLAHDVYTMREILLNGSINLNTLLQNLFAKLFKMDGVLQLWRSIFVLLRFTALLLINLLCAMLLNFRYTMINFIIVIWFLYFKCRYVTITLWYSWLSRQDDYPSNHNGISWLSVWSPAKVVVFDANVTLEKNPMRITKLVRNRVFGTFLFRFFSDCVPIMFVTIDVLFLLLFFLFLLSVLSVFVKTI